MIKKLKQNKVIILIGIIILILTFLTINLFSGNKFIKKSSLPIINSLKYIPINTTLSYYVYNYKDGDIKCLIKIEDDSELESIINPDGAIINANGKTTVYFDFTVEIDKEYIFKVKSKNGTEKDNILKITQDDIDKLVTITYYNGNNENSEVVSIGDTITLKNLTKDGYIFKGWSLISDGDIIEESEYLVTEDTDFFAIWDIDIETIEDDENLLLPKPDYNSFGSAWVYGQPSDAFDNDESTVFFPDIGTNAMNLYVGYNFQKAVKCYKVEVSFSKYNSVPNFKYQIEGLKEDGTWEAISEVLTFNDELLHLVVNTTNHKPHTSYRLKGLTDTVIHIQNYYHVHINELKFYCLE